MSMETETIPRNDCLQIGYLQKPHGVKGEVVLKFQPEFGASLEQEPVLLIEIDGLLVPFFPEQEGVRFRTAETVMVKFRWIDDEVHARQICGSPVYLKKEDRIDDGGEMSLHELTGFQLTDEKLGTIGVIEQVDDYGGNLVAQLTYNGREVLVPVSEDLITGFDADRKVIRMRCPDGIFDLN